MMPTVMTVTGPVPADQLGVVLTHEHVFFNHMLEYRGDGLMQDERLAEIELRRLVDAGCRTLCDVTSNGVGRHPRKLRNVSAATGLQIVMGSGWYRHPFLDHAYFDTHSTDEIAAGIVADIENGVGDTGVRAGIIGEIACDRHITPAEERSFRAAARAHLRTGVTITTHAARWPVGLPQLDILEQEGVDPRRVIIGHCDMVPDRDYHLSLAKRGAWVEFDTIDGDSDYDSRIRLEFILDLVGAGHIGQILLSQDICLRSQFSTYGGIGYTFLLTDFLPMLRDAGLSDSQVRQLVEDNPRKALTGEA
jgi:predicted metal-dependent phosphotriesterase family hydrolase